MTPTTAGGAGGPPPQGAAGGSYAGGGASTQPVGNPTVPPALSTPDPLAFQPSGTPPGTLPVAGTSQLSPQTPTPVGSSMPTGAASSGLPAGFTQGTGTNSGNYYYTDPNNGQQYEVAGTEGGVLQFNPNSQTTVTQNGQSMLFGGSGFNPNGAYSYTSDPGLNNVSASALESYIAGQHAPSPTAPTTTGNSGYPSGVDVLPQTYNPANQGSPPTDANGMPLGGSGGPPPAGAAGGTLASPSSSYTPENMTWTTPDQRYTEQYGAPVQQGAGPYTLGTWVQGPPTGQYIDNATGQPVDKSVVDSWNQAWQAAAAKLGPGASPRDIQAAMGAINGVGGASSPTAAGAPTGTSSLSPSGAANDTNPSSALGSAAASSAPQMDANGMPTSSGGAGATANGNPNTPSSGPGGISLTPTTPATSLTNSTISVGALNDPLTMAENAYETFRNNTNPEYEAELRDANRYAAAGGAIGSGELNTSLGNIANQRQNTLNTEEQSLINSALGQENLNAYQNVGIAQQQQGFQAGQQQTAFNQSAETQQLAQSAQGQQFSEYMQSLGFNSQQIQDAFNRAMQEFYAGNISNPAAYLEYVATHYNTPAGSQGFQGTAG